RAVRQAAEQARRQREELRRQAQSWLCPTCGTAVDPDDYDDEHDAGPVPGTPCPSCRSRRECLDRERAEAEAERERQRRAQGLLGWLRG
ncbi:hypothetical protein ABZZ36_37110, partial [Actinacidiphila glaucinigra]|uniref:hypothetical protein n=1 Tax=Actinacidiphila glaucinigra TaxID=235986 RepID=UPI0033A5E7BA